MSHFCSYKTFVTAAKVQLNFCMSNRFFIFLFVNKRKTERGNYFPPTLNLFMFFYSRVYILIGAGSLIMLVGFFGCCGAVRESQCLIFLFFQFFTCLLIIFGAEVAAGVFGFLNKDKIIEDVQNFYSEAYLENSNSTMILSYQKVVRFQTTDCETKIKDFFDSKLFIIGYVGIGIAGIIGMIFSMVLCCAIRNSREVI
uniref:Tetraspanin 2b n=1 Tax=Poecilia reticulata TaxID=8081 RepID=A0A3P9MZ03_POERE